MEVVKVYSFSTYNENRLNSNEFETWDMITENELEEFKKKFPLNEYELCHGLDELDEFIRAGGYVVKNYILETKDGYYMFDETKFILDEEEPLGDYVKVSI